MLEKIDEDGEISEHEIYACEECGFQEPLYYHNSRTLNQKDRLGSLNSPDCPK